MADHVSRRLLTQQQRKRINEDRFSGAGFAGQQVQACGELHRHVVDDRVVLQPQLEQHNLPVKGKLLEAYHGKIRVDPQCASAVTRRDLPSGSVARYAKTFSKSTY